MRWDRTVRDAARRRNASDATAALLMISVRVDDIAAETVGHEVFWPEA